MTATKSISYSYVKGLTADDYTKRFYEGYPYRRSWMLLFRPNILKNKIDTLDRLYPYQRTIRQTKEDYECERRQAITEGLTITAASWFLIYQFAKRGVVAPLFRQYGSFFKTHRVFRHYLYALAIPVPTLLLLHQYSYLNHVEYLWSVHANRMNKGIFTEPNGICLPDELKKQRVPLYPPRLYRGLEHQKKEDEYNQLTIEYEIELKEKTKAERYRIERENEGFGGYEGEYSSDEE